MKYFTIALISLMLSACYTNRFIDSQNNVTLIKSPIDSDSFLFLRPAFTVWHYSSNFDFNYPLEHRGRSNTFSVLLNSAIQRKGFEINNDINTSCMNNKLVVGKWDNKDYHDYNKHTCVCFNDSLYNVFFNVRMQINEASYDVSGREYELIELYVLIVKKKKVVYYRRYNYSRMVKPKRFPVGSKDRNEYPYFANDKIEKVVNEVTNELFRVIH